jgi:HEAT repeat protein
MRFLACAALSLATALGASGAQESKWVEVRFHRVYLRNGNFIDGNLVGDTERQVVLKLKVGEMVLRRDQVDHVEFVKIRSLEELPQVVRPPAKITPAHKIAAKPIGERKNSLLVLSRSVPESLCRRADELIGRWSENQVGDLARDLQSLGSDVGPYLCALIEQRRNSVPVAVVCGALGLLGDPDAIPSLAKLMTSEFPEERAAMVAALAAIGVPKCAPPLLDALNDELSMVYDPASKALVAMSRKEILSGLSRTILRRMSGAKNKVSHAITLGRQGDPEAREGLRDLLGTGDDKVVVAALQGLSEIKNPEDAHAVEPLLRVESIEIRKTACIYLGKVKHLPAVPDLIRFLQEEDRGVSSNAHWALREISGERYGTAPDLWSAWWEGVGSR